MYIEFNADSPASAFYNTVHQGIFRDFPVMKALEESFIIEERDQATMYCDAMLAAYREFGIDEPPRIVLTDWEDVSTRPEFELAVEWFERRGVPAAIADPRELEFRDGAIWAGGFRANLVNRRVILRELVDRIDESGALIEAARSGKVCIVNPFSAKIVGNKAALAFLSDSRNRSHFSPEEREVIEKHLPWSAVLTHEPVEFRARSMDPFDVAVKYKERMVLKPLNDYGGRGFMILD